MNSHYIIKLFFIKDMEQWNKALDAYADLHKVVPFTIVVGIII